MEKVPNMISTKDLSYISDMFNWHLVAAQKFEHYLEHVEDETCTKKLNDLCDMHRQICINLLDLIESGKS